MPKLKTHKGAAARFHITGSGKIMRLKTGRSHLRTHKSKRVKASYHDKIELKSVDHKRISRLIPNGV